MTTTTDLSHAEIVHREWGAYAAEHYSGGDTVVRDQIDSGTHPGYWTVIDSRTRATLCGGRRWERRYNAEAWLEFRRRHGVGQDVETERGALDQESASEGGA